VCTYIFAAIWPYNSVQVCAAIYTYVYIYLYVHVHIYLCTRMYIYIDVCVFTHLQLYGPEIPFKSSRLLATIAFECLRKVGGGGGE